MQAFMVLANLTPTDGYLFIKGCAKKKPELIKSFKDRFIIGCRNNSIHDNIINKIWDDMQRFGGYAFNKSHAISYAVESFKTAYLKAHYPTEFICARLSVENIRRKFDEVEKYETDAQKNFGIQFVIPSLNDSKTHYTIVGERKIRKSILVKGVGIKAAEDIVKNQPYTGKDILYSFASKVGSAVNSKVVESLKDAGLFKDIPKTKLLSDFEKIKKDKRATRNRPNFDIFG